MGRSSKLTHKASLQYMWQGELTNFWKTLYTLLAILNQHYVTVVLCGCSEGSIKRRTWMIDGMSDYKDQDGKVIMIPVHKIKTGPLQWRSSPSFTLAMTTGVRHPSAMRQRYARPDMSPFTLLTWDQKARMVTNEEVYLRFGPSWGLTWGKGWSGCVSVY